MVSVKQQGAGADRGVDRMLSLLRRAGCTERQIECYRWRLGDRWLTLEAIGERVGISGPMVYRHLARARMRLEELAAREARGQDWLYEMGEVEAGTPLDIRLIEHLVREDIEEHHQVTGEGWWRPATLRH